MLKVLELFAGIGACSKALERLGIEHEIVDAVEIDKYAIASFNAIHGTNFETQDITTWDKDLECDLIMHGSPCQDFSVAGKQAGGDEGSGTRSSLMYETIRIVGKLRPKYVVWENVKNLLSKKHKHNFDAYIETMNILGYNSYYQVLNAKDYGIPQNRERVFTVSIRKDIDRGAFTFPEKEPLKLRLKDMLEEQVDEKYYLSDKMMDYVLKPGTKGYMKEPELNNEIAKPLLATMTKMHRAGIDNYIAEPKCVQVGNLAYPDSETRRGRVGHQVAQTLQCNDSMGVVVNEIKVLGNYMPSGHDASRIVDSEGLAPTVKENHGTVTATVVKDEKQVERTPLKFLNRNQKNIEGDYAFCVDSCNTGGVKEMENNNIRIRKLTPKECWSLMRI